MSLVRCMVCDSKLFSSALPNHLIAPRVIELWQQTMAHFKGLAFTNISFDQKGVGSII
jgi:hypothetical protein